MPHPWLLCLCALLTRGLCLVACNPDVSGLVLYSGGRDKDSCDEEPHEKSYSAAHIRTKVWGCNVCLFSSCCPPLSLTVAQWPRYNVSPCMYPVCTCWIHCCNTAGIKMCVGDIIVSFPRNTAGGKFGEHAKNRVLPDIFRSASKAPWMSQPSLVSWMKKPQVMIKCANVTMYSYNWSLLKGLMCIIKMVLWAWNENWKNWLFRFIWRHYKWCWCQTFHGAARLHHNMSPVAQNMHLLGVPLGIHSDIAGRYNLTSVHRYQHKLSAVYFVTIWCYQISHVTL